MSVVIIKSASEIEAMRLAGRLAAQTLAEAGKMVRPGENTKAINDFVHEYTLRHHGIPAPLNYRGFPESCCTSVNEVVCHGIPSKKVVLKEGDIINIDITTILDGWHGDVSATFYVGQVSDEARRLVEATRECLRIGIAQVREGARIGDIGAAIQEYAENLGYSVVYEYCGHGIGRLFHEDLSIPHYGSRNRGLRLKKGMVFTIEPMINIGVPKTVTLKDNWTAVTADRKLSAQFEHTLAVTEDGADILTEFPEALTNTAP